MMGLGVQELLIIFGIVILVFGVNRLPALGKNIGEGIRNFKWSMKQVTGEDGDDSKGTRRKDGGD